MDTNAKFAGVLTIVEIGVGSFLHAFKLPLSGQILSLNQIFILSRASLYSEKKDSPAIISTSAGLLKVLAPAGKKLTPMLAITAQGHLYSFGLFLFGINIIGRIVGALMSSTWAFIQPITIYFILFGEDLIFMTNYYLSKIQKIYPIETESLFYILAFVIITKMIIAILTVLIATNISTSRFEKYIEFSTKYKNRGKKKKKMTYSPSKGALKDLFSPILILSFVLLAIFYFYSKSDYTTIIWLTLRPVALAYLIFYVIRIFPIEKVALKMKDGKYKETILNTIEYIKTK